MNHNFIKNSIDNNKGKLNDVVHLNNFPRVFFLSNPKRNTQQKIQTLGNKTYPITSSRGQKQYIISQKKWGISVKIL